MTRSFNGMKLKHIATVMDALVGLIQKDDFPLTELILAENKLKNDIHDFINALGSNQSLQKLGTYGTQKNKEKNVFDVIASSSSSTFIYPSISSVAYFSLTLGRRMSV